MVDFHGCKLTRFGGWDSHGVVNYNGRFLLTDFWFGGFAQAYKEVSSVFFTPVGLSVGWFLVFLFQVSTLLLWFVQLIRSSLPRRDTCALLVLLLPWASFVFGVGQSYVQSNVEYRQLNNVELTPYFGLWMAAVSVVLLLISFWRSSEADTLRRSGWKKVALSIFLLSIVGFFIVNETEFQTKVTKNMYVGYGDMPGDPDKSTVDFHRLLVVAGIFRARIVENSAEYGYCELEVPVVSYGTLVFVLRSMGFAAREPIFLRLLESSS